MLKDVKFFLPLILLIVGTGSGLLSTELNPGCDSAETNCSKPHLFVVHSVPSENSSLPEYYQLWSGSGVPSFTVLEVSGNTSLDVQWGKDGVEAVTPSEPPLAVFGVAVPELVLFNDTADTGSIKDSTERQPLATNRLAWQLVLKDSPETLEAHFTEEPVTEEADTPTATATKADKEGSSVFASLQAVSLDDEPLPDGVHFSFELAAHPASTRQPLRPRLLVPPQGFSLEFVFDNFTLDLRDSVADAEAAGNASAASAAISGYTSARWAARLVLGSGEQRADGPLSHTASRSLDDEFAPGVFKLDDIATPATAATPPHGGYMQYRPVVYLSPDRDITNSTTLSLSAPEANDTSTAGPVFSAQEPGDQFAYVDELSPELQSSVLYALLGDNMTSALLTEETFLSFGMQEDGYYTAWDYLVFSVTVGVGAAPAEGMSTAVIAVIAVGLGLPVMALLGAGVAYAVLRARRGRADREPLLVGGE